MLAAPLTLPCGPSRGYSRYWILLSSSWEAAWVGDTSSLSCPGPCRHMLGWGLGSLSLRTFLLSE